MMKPIELQAMEVFLRFLEPHLARMVACQNLNTLDDMYETASRLESRILNKILLTSSANYHPIYHIKYHIKYQTHETSPYSQEEGHYE